MQKILGYLDEERGNEMHILLVQLYISSSLYNLAKILKMKYNLVENLVFYTPNQKHLLLKRLAGA